MVSSGDRFQSRFPMLPYLLNEKTTPIVSVALRPAHYGLLSMWQTVSRSRQLVQTSEVWLFCYSLVLCAFSMLVSEMTETTNKFETMLIVHSKKKCSFFYSSMLIMHLTVLTSPTVFYDLVPPSSSCSK